MKIQVKAGGPSWWWRQLYELADLKGSTQLMFARWKSSSESYSIWSPSEHGIHCEISMTGCYSLPKKGCGQLMAIDSLSLRWLGNSIRCSKQLPLEYGICREFLNTPTSLRIDRSLHENHWIVSNSLPKGKPSFSYGFSYDCSHFAVAFPWFFHRLS